MSHSNGDKIDDSRRQESPIYVKFHSDKESTYYAIKRFLDLHPQHLSIASECLEKYRNDIVTLVSQGNFTQAIETLERLRDAKNGILIKEEVTQDGVPIVFRDARAAKNEPVRETEAFEMQYLNVVRAGIDIAELEDKPELNKILTEEASKCIVEFSNHKGFSQKDLSGSLKTKKIKKIADILEEHGLRDAYTKLNISKDFQNFNDRHSNIVTISSIEHHGEKHTIIEAEVALKGLTKSQKDQYQSLLEEKGLKPSWYTAMPRWEQSLCRKYASKIIAGDHVIPTQLRQIAGMKNAFEKTTALYDGENLEILHTSKHAGTLASLSRDEGTRQDITDGNAEQAKEWIGVGRILHCNTTNSGPFGAGDDPEIVRRTKKAMINMNGKLTNTAFNFFRHLGFANDLKGVRETLSTLAACFPEHDDFEPIQLHLQPKTYVGRLFSDTTPEKDIQSLFDKLKINSISKEILTCAIDLGNSVEKADSLLRFEDSDNASLDTCTKLNYLTYMLSKLESPPQGMIKLPPREEILTMCASGKDRTGLAQHDQSARAIAAKIGASISDVDRQLLASGHTAQQAGGVHSGGATIGCFGTKTENKAGIPAARKRFLEAIVEITADSNKIKMLDQRHFCFCM